MELRHLRYFIVLAEELNFGRASQRLNIVQPALSKQMRDLEKELGFALFERSTRQVKLTTAGQRFLEGAKRTLATSEQAVIEGRRASQGELGSLTIGYSRIVYCHLLPTILQRYHSLYPEVQLTLLDLASENQLQGLVNGTLDLGLIIHTEGLLVDDMLQQLNCETLIVEPMVIAVSSTHPLALAGAKTVKLEQLASESWILCPRDLEPRLTEQTTKIFNSAGFTPIVAQEVSQQWFAVHLVAAGLGVAPFPKNASSIGIGEVSFLEVSEPEWKVNFCTLWNKQNLSACLQAFLQIVNQVRQSC